MAEFNILDHLDKLEPDGGTNNPRGDHSYFCPGCKSNNFKVNVKTGKWGCFGCDCSSTEAGKRKIREALSPAVASSSSAAKTKPIRPEQKRKWEYFTPITLARNTPALIVHRTDDGNGKRNIWQESLVEGHRPAEVKDKVLPYGLTEAQQALADGAPYVFWVEGEPCVDAFRALGLFAISSIGGAGKFNPDRDAGHIPGDRLVVVPDRDKPGVAHMEDVAAEHTGCQWLYPFPGTPEWNGEMPKDGGLDVVDWINTGATVEHILNGIGPKSTEPAADFSEDLPLNERITLAITELLDSHLANDASRIDAAFSEIWKLGVSRDRAQERMLMLWAQQHGLNIDDSAKAQQPSRGRVLGKAKEGKGLRQQLPGFCIDKDLHILVSDAAGGKTTAAGELCTVMTARDKGFLDHEAPRSDPADDPRNTALVIASDGEGSAYSMWEDYLNTISAVERGANIEIWAEDDDTGERAWNISLHNLERLCRRLAEGDVCIVVIDTANSVFRGAGVNVGIGPIETYLRLLKQIVCRYCSLWITHHTNRNSGPTIKAISGHPAFQEVPSAIHLIEVKDNADGERLRIWHVLKLRGSNYRRFSYSLTDGELKVTDGHFFHNCNEQVLVALEKQISSTGGTTPADLINVTRRPAQSVYNALNELRSDRLIRPRGRGYRITAGGMKVLESLRIATDALPDWAA